MAAVALLLTFVVIVGPIMAKQRSQHSHNYEVQVPLNVACLLSGAMGVLALPMPTPRE